MVRPRGFWSGAYRRDPPGVQSGVKFYVYSAVGLGSRHTLNMQCIVSAIIFTALSSALAFTIASEQLDIRMTAFTT